MYTRQELWEYMCQQCTAVLDQDDQPILNAHGNNQQKNLMNMIVTELAKEDISRLDPAATFGHFCTLFARIHQDIYNRGIVFSNLDIGMPRVTNNNGRFG